jgi:predicted patatin/cPLA2 family phospholipase
MPFECEGDLRVLDSVIQRSRRFEAGASCHEDTRPWLIVSGGALCGTYCAGQLSALLRARLKNGFVGARASSTGSPGVTSFASETVFDARSMYWIECTYEQFLSLQRLALWLPGIGLAPAMNIDYLCDVFRGTNERGVRLVNHDKLRAWQTDFRIAVTRLDGSGAFLDMRTVEDPIEAVKASIAIPGISRGYVRVGDEILFDGDATGSLPVAEVLRHSPTDILVLANRPKPREDEAGRVIPDPMMPSRYLESLPRGVQNAFSTKHLRYVEELNLLRTQTICRYLIIWTDGVVGPFNRNPKKLEAAALRADEHLGGLLENCLTKEAVYA